MNEQMSSNDTASNPPPPVEAPAAKEVFPSFAELGVSADVCRALADMGFTAPMKVQAVTMPLVKEGRDLMVQSRTGSGKTAAFGIPLIDKVVAAADKFVQAIILLPTRELALQVAAELARIATHSGVSVVPVYGGAPMGRQIEQLRAGGQIVCGTPGRVMDHMRRGTLKLDRVKCAVLDECDEMLSMGFQEDIEAILEETPATRQTLLFSATLPEGIKRLSRRFLKNPEHLKLSADFVGVQEIRHVYYSIPGGQREQELMRILSFENPERGIIFCNTREETGRVAEFLRRNGIEAEAISSDLSQSDRERVMARMRAGGIRFLVATDVAARGIDLENLPAVFNYTFPDSPEIYIHRTGRTGRAGRSGTAISLIGPAEVGPFYYVKLLYKIKPEERSLPSEAEIRSRREGERVQVLRGLVAGEPGAEWKSLARRLITAVDGEKLVAGLLARVLASTNKEVVKPTALRSMIESEAPAEGEGGGSSGPGHDRSGARRFDRRPEAGGRDTRRDQPGFAPRGQDRERDPQRPEPARTERTEPVRTREERRPTVVSPTVAAERPVVAPLTSGEPPSSPAPAARTSAPLVTARPVAARSSVTPPAAPALSRTAPSLPPSSVPAKPARSAATDGEFWDVWSDAKPVPPTAPARQAPATLPPVAAGITKEGESRLFLSLGRKDGATAEEVAQLLLAAGTRLDPASIDLMNTHSYINVPAGEVERLVTTINGKERGGRRLLCEPARPRRR